MASDPAPPAVTLEVAGNSTRAAAALASEISHELAEEQLPSEVRLQLVGDFPVVEERGMTYGMAQVAAEYLMIRAVLRIRTDAEERVYQAVKRAVLRWRKQDPTTPILGPDGRRIEE